MRAIIYDKNYRRLGIINKGNFQNNHFVYYSGGVPILGSLPLIKAFFAPTEYKIQCNIEETLDDVVEYSVFYRKVGDRYEQMPMRKETVKGVDVQGALKEIELSEARIDSIIKPPESNLPIINIGLTVLAILILIGVYLTLKGLPSQFNTAFSGANTTISVLKESIPQYLNISKGLNTSIHLLNLYLQSHSSGG